MSEPWPMCVLFFGFSFFSVFLVCFNVVLYGSVFSKAFFTIFTVSFVYYFCVFQWLHFVCNIVYIYTRYYTIYQHYGRCCYRATPLAVMCSFFGGGGGGGLLH